ncbi:MAG: ATP synthase F0 subunit B [Candidatus Moranbacteria bacterium RIFCSPHIGHO2_12_FULL_54_9]|nr:MAG: ATP synthase F0 subunit B [Candidatus Moranbacteria bacterium RIFCSPHIGHO2_01_FULL_54_31]OGI25937.1 MAG: ATP synthase F0 subunit B [Candidatus Moranbacteria bacterium RIFCSPHIGHO2_12_FULL_54_9]
MEALANLGIDWKLLTAQAVNFLILLFVLRRFAYRPMLDFLEQRSDRIEQGLKDAEAAQVKLAQMEEREKATLAAARSEARSIVEAAEASAKKRDAERLIETEAATKRFTEEARVKIEEEKQKALTEAKQEIAQVVTASVEKILKETVDAAKDQDIIKKSLH